MKDPINEPPIFQSINEAIPADLWAPPELQKLPVSETHDLKKIIGTEDLELS